MVFLTSGTTSEPKLVAFQRDAWSRSVQRKARFLRQHRVGPDSLVWVAHPFAPWSIGHVFAEACCDLGARVVMVGLYLGTDAVSRRLLAVEPPTHICASGRNLMRWAADMASAGTARPKVDALFVAGEPLSDSLRASLRDAWSASVVDVYGTAETNMLGGELPDEVGVVLAPDLDFRLDSGGAWVPLSVGAEGVLEVKEPHADAWFNTGDLVDVVGKCQVSSFDGAAAWKVRVRGRTNELVTLADGTCVGALHVQSALQALPGLEALQLRVAWSKQGEHMTAICVRRPTPTTTPTTSAEVIGALLASSIDLADSVRHGVVSNVDVRFVGREELSITQRGKVRLVVRSEDA